MGFVGFDRSARWIIDWSTCSTVFDLGQIRSSLGQINSSIGQYLSSFGQINCSVGQLLSSSGQTPHLYPVIVLVEKEDGRGHFLRFHHRFQIGQQRHVLAHVRCEDLQLG